MRRRLFILLAVALVGNFLVGGKLFGGETVKENAAPVTSDTQAYLGLGVAPLHPALTNHLPEVIGEGRGVMVEEVVTGSPADKAGLKKYDVLVRINDQDLYSPEQLVKIVRNSKPNSSIALSYVRHGKIEDVKLTLGQQPYRQPVRSESGFRFPFNDNLLNWKNGFSDWSDSFQELQPPLAPKAGWETFKSLTLNKKEDGTYSLRLDYKDANNNEIRREYTGTRDDIKQAIEEDKELPADEREHLLRSLDKQNLAGFRRFPTPWTRDWQTELFNWPNLDF